jgi:peptidoglycan/xylan/chitin deacetylase (PgdA/CDA1 family)
VNNAQWFESVILYLKSAYKIVPLSAFENLGNSKNLCAITFDDGDLTFFDIAFPLLKKHNVPAAIFVSPQSIAQRENFWFQEVADYDLDKFAEIVAQETKIPYQVAKDAGIHAVLKSLPIEKIHHLVKEYQSATNTPPKEFRNMDLEKIAEVQRSGLISIGAHTLTHPILANETAEKCEHEIVNSVTDLEKLLGQAVRYFAYPNGAFGLDFGRREMDILQKAGIKIALSTDPNFVNRKADKLSLPRKGITYGNIRHIKMKILLGKKWNLLRNLRKPSEAKRRGIVKKNLLFVPS